jgi:hypothetical protein
VDEDVEEASEAGYGEGTPNNKAHKEADNADEA